MLDKSHKEAAYCYQRAEECRRMAERDCTVEQKATYLDLEARWMKLAASYEFSDRFNRFTASMVCILDEAKNQRS
jgi:hypothetical protein